ncbi:ribosome assembly RNA-binding protein YhbY [Lactiplantibacillus mudanjiangensis]|uniref:Ribosome assembly RNA-binding protein YhbY [Lactobacillus sp.] n=1 Tax=Lactiplantibacillus mudanjiangensis TaxID=1296538 RepID=A0A660E9A7_9LACO|nr:ribosome assembly RNA-binding protein YhbY [Lactiplantibacillus mudanjiangensis]VDG19884.1 ribosome assembly RNA-binding protein YhbY [Lactobacillus sp.] [Lactiplantibacillus mudanjiangensis]VDG25725.1 ribosome assembly RNA-binding protein YhbY [Lactobacillus sp.] [Lactiplantibacillus mudanjiangensis]VDG29731.1 ribosome assembly RNA-binding protein YhbY [Lactobacillus sp.] [Lactiplantibacillus mudanjiangensis]VDG31306.1 ribosome assembly RNA-binding protein YhbY [Lactobacillus sp.] [Lactipla
MENLRGKQKRYLRSQAHHLRPMFAVGKNGLTEEWLNQLVVALDKRELIKVNILQNADVTTDEVKEAIESNTPITVVQTIGRVLVLYLPASKADYQKISLAVAKI